MEPQINNTLPQPTIVDKDIEDASPDTVVSKTWDQAIVNPEDPGKYGRPFQSTNFIEGAEGWRLNSNGIAEFSGLIIRDVLYTVPLNGSIQNAIDILDNAGGGTVQLQSGTYTLTSDLTLADGISLVGTGVDSTIIEFSGGAYGIICVGTSGNILTNWSIKNLTVQNSNNTAGVEVDYADYWTIDNVKVTSCDQYGVQISRSRHFSVESSYFSSNTQSGMLITATASNDRVSKYGLITNCVSESNSLNGFKVANGGISRVYYIKFVGCSAISNTDDGFDLTGTSIAAETTLVGCSATSNGSDGFLIASPSNNLIGCFGSSNTGYGLNITHASNQIIGCSFTGNNSNNEQVNMGAKSTFVGNSSEQMLEADSGSRMWSNESARLANEAVVMKMLNSSGGTVNLGDVLVYANSTSGNGFTTTTTVGDDAACGMALGTITNGNYGDVLMIGSTASLKVDGTTDIAVGDFLCTFSTAKIAQKAGAGDMAFARACEAYTANDSSGVINALLITPRKL